MTCNFFYSDCFHLNDFTSFRLAILEVKLDM